MVGGSEGLNWLEISDLIDFLHERFFLLCLLYKVIDTDHQHQILGLIMDELINFQIISCYWICTLKLSDFCALPCIK